MSGVARAGGAVLVMAVLLGCRTAAADESARCDVARESANTAEAAIAAADPTTAASAAEQALDDADCFASNDRARLYNVFGAALFRLDRLEEAVNALRQGCAIREVDESGPLQRLNVSTCEVNLAVTELELGRATDAVSTLESADARVLAVLAEPGVAADVAEQAARMRISIQHNLTRAHVSDVETPPDVRRVRAEEASLEAERLRALHDRDNRTMEGQILGEYGELLLGWPGRENEGIAKLEQALERRDAGDPIGRGHALTDLAVAFEQVGYPGRALVYQQRALEAFQSVPGGAVEGYVARAMNNLCLLRLQLGPTESDVQCFGGVLARLDEAGRPDDQISWLVNAATQLLELPTSVAREGILAGVRPLMVRLDAVLERHALAKPSRVWLLEAQVATLEGDEAARDQALERALATAQTLGPWYDTVTRVLLVIGEGTPERVERVSEAACETLERLEEMGAATPDRRAVISHNAAWAIGEAALATGDLDVEPGSAWMAESARWAKEAVAAHEQSVGTDLLSTLVSCDAQRGSTPARGRAIYLLAALTHDLSGQPDLEQTFAYLQRASGSLARLTRLAALRQAAGARGDAGVALRASIETLERQAPAICEGRLDAGERERLAESLDDAVREAGIDAHARAGTVGIDRVIGALEDGEAMVGLLESELSGLRFMFYRDGDEARLLVRSHEGSATAFAEARQRLQSALRVDPGAILQPFPLEAAETVYDTLLGDLMATAAVDGFVPEHLLIVQSETLIGLPLNALRSVNPDGDREWLGHRYTLSQLPSIGAVLDLSRDPSNLERFVGLARPLIGDNGLDDLPASEREVRDVGTRFPSANRALLIGPDATAARLLESLAEPADLIVLATHSARTLDPVRGNVLGLVTTSEPSGRATLLASDLASVPLDDTELLIMSACSSATEGADLSDLLSSVIGGGARHALATQWVVADASTAELVDTVVARVMDGAGTADALRDAMVALSEEPATAHPYYWAPFLHFGLPQQSR